MTAPAAARPRNAYIDTLRGLSIFGVVCIHFAGSFVTTDVHAWSPSFYLGLALNQGFIFAVPLFVFLSGYLAASSRRSVSLGEYYTGRLTRIGLPYLLVSALSFFLLNHQPEWAAQPDIGSKFTWLLKRLLFTGVEPTLYFIPLILQLYVLQPALRELPAWLHKAIPALSLPRATTALTLLLLGLHLALGLLCYHGKLDYYTWGRPNPLFWAFYFFAGLHFRTLSASISPRALRTAAVVALVVALGAMSWNFLQLTDRSFVGERFERNILDFAYVRPEMLAYDLAVVLLVSCGLALNLSFRPNALSYLGPFTLEIYLWHILVLYYGAWRYADALANCRQVPEVIIAICIVVSLAIAGLTDAWDRFKTYFSTHRLIMVRDDSAETSP